MRHDRIRVAFFGSILAAGLTAAPVAAQTPYDGL